MLTMLNEDVHVLMAVFAGSRLNTSLSQMLLDKSIAEKMVIT